MTGFDPSTLRVVATVPQTQVAAIQAGGKARIEVPSLGRWVDVKSITIVPAADPRTHTTHIRLELPADVRGVYPGVFARAHFVIGTAPRLLVPRAAVVRRSEVTAVYVVDEQGAPRCARCAWAAPPTRRGIEVLAGLKPGERVALDPVKAGMATRRRRILNAHTRKETPWHTSSFWAPASAACPPPTTCARRSARSIASPW